MQERYQTLSLLPFRHITNVELYQTLETAESHIKACLKDKNFTTYINSLLPDNNTLTSQCKYYTAEQFNSLHKNNKNTCNTEFRLLHHNIRSLDLHFGELLALLSSLEDNFDFVALSEIGNKNIESRENQLKKMGYGFKYKTPSLSRGGVGLIFNSNYKLTERDDLIIQPKVINNKKLEIENIWFETNFPEKADNYVIGVIYKHPGSSVECLDYFTQQIENKMIKLNQENKKCIITGDINIDGLKINKNNQVKNFFRSVLEQNFIPTLTLPTRIVDSQVSLIDHILINTNTIKNNKDITTGNIYCDITDHLPNFITIKSYKHYSKHDRPLVRIYGEENMAKFKGLLLNSPWEEFFSTNDENMALYIFYKIYNTAFNKAFPLKRLSRNRAKDKKWINSGLKSCIHIKDNLYKAFVLKPTAENRNKHTKYKNILISCLRKAEENHFKNLIGNERQNLFKLWNIFGDIINPHKTKKKNHIDKLITDNKIITDSEDIANALNDHFCTIGEKLADNNDNEKRDFQKYLKTHNVHSLFLNPTSEQEILDEISKLNPKKSSGHDNISPKILIECSEILTAPITHIINLSFNNARVPDKLKIAKVIPIYKKNEKYYADNYRPISLLSTINKIMEKLMYKRLIAFLNKYKILYEYQFGFRENHSTTLALIEIIDNIIMDLEKGKYVAGIYLDLSKAFDTVDHEILLYKLNQYGIRGQSLKWFESYLSNRQQFTHINDKQSKLKPINYGVPQGSVLGPLLFLIYTNDIIHCTRQNCKMRLFADDTNGFISANSPKELKDAMSIFLKDIFKWCKTNKLTVNIPKTCYTIFKVKNRKIPDSLNSITINKVQIKRVSSAKYLGVIVDENLSWEDHIENLNKCIIKTANSFKIIKNHVHQDNKKVLYNAYILAKIQYGIEIYGRANTSVIKKVQIQQNRALKILYNKDYFTSTTVLHSDLEILMVQDIYKLSIAKFVYKQKNELLPIIFTNFFKENNQIHSYNTRQTNNIHQTHTDNKYSKLTTKYQGTAIWNSIPKEIRNLITVRSFSRNVKIIFLKSY